MRSLFRGKCHYKLNFDDAKMFSDVMRMLREETSKQPPAPGGGPPAPAGAGESGSNWRRSLRLSARPDLAAIWSGRLQVLGTVPMSVAAAVAAELKMALFVPSAVADDLRAIHGKWRIKRHEAIPKALEPPVVCFLIACGEQLCESTLALMEQSRGPFIVFTRCDLQLELMERTPGGVSQAPAVRPAAGGPTLEAGPQALQAVGCEAQALRAVGCEAQAQKKRGEEDADSAGLGAVDRAPESISPHHVP